MSEKEPGTLTLRGDEFELEMKYDIKKVIPETEFIEVTDKDLKRFWQDGVTRIIFTLDTDSLQGNNKIVDYEK